MADGGNSLRCKGLSRRNRLRLAARVCDSDRVGRVVDDNGIVDVVVDDVRRRRRHGGWWIVIGWDGHVVRNRQNEKSKCRRWRCKNHKLWRRRHQEKYRRRRRRIKVIVRIVENQHRPTEINYFLFQRRRNIIGDDRERRRRLVCRGKISKAAMRIGDMRAARVPPKIRPVRLRRVDIPRPPPGNRFAARSHNGTNPFCHWFVGIGREKI